MTELRESLVQAEHHAAQGQAVIDDQRAHVATLTRQGDDAQEAVQLLRLFEAAQETLIAYRDCLRRLIANIESDWPQSAGTRTTQVEAAVPRRPTGRKCRYSALLLAD